MKISYVHSVCVQHDAISNAIRDELAFLRQAGYADVRLFAARCDNPPADFTQVDHPSQLLLDPHFQRSDLVVFHFGIYYPLFDLLPLIPSSAARLVVFHNITPRELVAPPDRSVIDRSFAQLSNVRWADHVFCVSQTNLSVLRQHGIANDATVVPLAIHSDLEAPLAKPSFEDDIVRIAFVGRFVRSKGPHELLEATDRLLRRTDRASLPALQLELVGNITFSDSILVERLHNQIESLHLRHGARIRAKLLGNSTEQVKHEILKRADLFVLPTYHEGFCVPIIEALASGCRVLTYKNSNTPAVCADLGLLAPTGDIEALSEIMGELVSNSRSRPWKCGRSSEDGGSYLAYVAKAAHHVEQFKPPAVAQQFLCAVEATCNAARLPRKTMWPERLPQASSAIDTRMVQARVFGIDPFDFEIHSREDRYISTQLATNGHWEPFETDVLRRLAQPGDFILDLGGNIGWYGVIASKVIGSDGRLLTYEPDPTNYAMLMRNLSRCRPAPSISARQEAVGDRSGVVKLFLSSFNMGDHHLFDDGEVRHAIDVPLNPLDTILSQEKRLPDIVKSDTQGSEARIIRGARNLFGRGWRPIMILEFWPYGLASSGDNALDLWRELCALGYAMYEVNEDRPRLYSISTSEIEQRLATSLTVESQAFINILAIHPLSGRIEKVRALISNDV